MLTPERYRVHDFTHATSTYEFVWKSAIPKERTQLHTIMLTFDEAIWAALLLAIVATIVLIASYEEGGNCNGRVIFRRY